MVLAFFLTKQFTYLLHSISHFSLLVLDRLFLICYTARRRKYVARGFDRFFFRVIQLWEVAAEALLQAGWLAVLPLVTLTRGGKRPEVVKEMIDRLVVAEEYDLLAIAQVLGGLVFKEGPEQEWFKGRFSMFQDILSESWVYQEIGQKYLEQGLEQGVEKGREEGRIQEQREMLVRLVQRRFPELEALAKQQSDGITNPEILPSVNFKLLDAQTVEEARQILLDLDKM